MKKLLLAMCVVGALSLAPAALAYFSVDTLPPTWHIHNGGTCSQCAKTLFFPTILNEDLSIYLQNPAECPDATDKAFLGGGEPSISNPPSLTGNQPLGEGICQTSTTIIHLKRISPNQPVPAGFSGPVGSPTVVQGETFLTYYMLTPY